MKKTIASIAFIALLAAPAVLEASDFCAEPADTEYGQVRGEKMEGSETCVWRGIPFAAPPVDELRWAAPKPHPGWDGVRDATGFGAQCMQKGIMAVESKVNDQPMSEDCLYLNVWRPTKSGKFPVMVWVHGGGYHGGSGMTPWYWGDRLAERGDLVVVTINYRLNIFGFMAHPALAEEDPNGSTGSYGTLDQVEALKWVHENIEAFGGDPDNVTIFGESAGGWSICTLLATPLARDLFHRAILESGGCETSQDLDEGYEDTRESAKAMGCDFEDVECMRSLPAKKIMKKAVGGMTSGISFVPHHDGYVLTDTPLTMIKAGDYNQVPFMAGSNRDEFGKALKLSRNLYFTRPKNYEQKLIRRFGMTPEQARELVGLYPLSEFDNRPVEAYGRMFGADASLACPTYEGLLAAAKQQEATYYYRFDYDGNRFGKYTGAAHALEIPHIFGNLDRMPANFLFNDKNMAEAQDLSRIIQGYVINFAKTGDPNASGLPEWPEFDPDNQKVQVFDTEVRTEPADNVERCAFWAEQDTRRSLDELSEN